MCRSGFSTAAATVRQLSGAVPPVISQTRPMRAVTGPESMQFPGPEPMHVLPVPGWRLAQAVVSLY